MFNPLTLIGFALGIILGFIVRYLFAKQRVTSVEGQIATRLDQARAQEKEIVLGAERKALELAERARKERDQLLSETAQRSDRLDKREEILQKREEEGLRSRQELGGRETAITQRQEQLERREKQVAGEFERISGMSREEALKVLFEKVEHEHVQELRERMVKQMTHQQEELQQKALEVILGVLPRYSRSVVSESVTTVVPLTNDDMKGRIIGKEGRNIRHFENLTGVELIIDETPGVVTISSFDPVRREIARVALEKLLKDGRIHPATIEESIASAKDSIENEIREAGKRAAYEIGILDLPEPIIHLMGRLKFRTSYGQNVLQHSIEVSHFSGMIAEELGLDREVAKKGGFLHDIGKSVDHQIEGTHLEIGIKILQKYGVDERVVLAMRSHHETYPFAIPEAYVVLAADAISAKRLGARGETGELYIKRLEELEKVATSFPGVERTYAISGGREVRIFVKADEITDLDMLKLAQAVARKIERDVRYPGEIKVVVIREKRSVEYAR